MILCVSVVLHLPLLSLWFPNLLQTFIQIRVCHKRQALFSIIEVDIYVFANNVRTVECGSPCPQTPPNWFLGHSRNATQEMQTVHPAIQFPFFWVNCTIFHTLRRKNDRSKQYGSFLRYVMKCLRGVAVFSKLVPLPFKGVQLYSVLLYTIHPSVKLKKLHDISMIVNSTS